MNSNLNNTSFNSRYITNFLPKKIPRAFTLVELLVVIAILAILATTGFIAYTSHLPSVRDAARVDQLSSLRSNLETYRLGRKLPSPTDSISVKVNGKIIGKQGYAGKVVLQDINIQDGGKDPLDKEYYSYYITSNKKDFQLLTFLEQRQELDLSMTKTFAEVVDYGDRHSKVLGSELGILTESLSNRPIQDLGIESLDIATTGGSYIAHLTDTENISGNGTKLISSSPYASCKRIKEVGNENGNGTYKINPTGTKEILVYCDMKSDGGGWTLVGTLDNSPGYAWRNWLDSDQNIYGISSIKSIIDASLSNIDLQGMRPTEFRWHPGDPKNNLNLSHYFYIKPNYDIDYTKLFRNVNPNPGTDLSKHTWYWTTDGGLTKWIGRTYFENSYLMLHRDSDGNECGSGVPCGVFDFDIYTDASPVSFNLANWAREGEPWFTYMGRKEGIFIPTSINMSQGSSDGDFAYLPSDYTGKLKNDTTKLSDYYGSVSTGLGVFVR